MWNQIEENVNKLTLELKLHLKQQLGEKNNNKQTLYYTY